MGYINIEEDVYFVFDGLELFPELVELEEHVILDPLSVLGDAFELALEQLQNHVLFVLALVEQD